MFASARISLRAKRHTALYQGALTGRVSSRARSAIMVQGEIPRLKVTRRGYALKHSQNLPRSRNSFRSLTWECLPRWFW